jgi:hypothetical protein
MREQPELNQDGLPLSLQMPLPGNHRLMLRLLRKSCDDSVGGADREPLASMNPGISW